jgi:hypothetical protein
VAKLANKILLLRRIAPKASRYGQLYRDISQTRVRYKRVWFWTLYVSDENTHMVRKHLFKKDNAMSPKEWHAWFARNMDKIQRSAVLPGLAIRTDLSKQWAVARYIGWVGDAKHATRHTAARRTRNKTKSSRRTSG